MTIVGNCPKCGCPIYAQVVWHGITPPPSIRSCSCYGGSPNSIFTTFTMPDTSPVKT